MDESQGIREGLDTRYFVEESNALGRVPELLAAVNVGQRPALLVYDINTRRVAGARVGELLHQEGQDFAELLLEPEDSGLVSPGYEWVETLRDIIKNQGRFPVAVGSGVINDLVKRAAFEAGIPYICVGTASSMDGYASFGASLVKNGYKITLPCTPPAAIVADTDIIRAAPYDMTASGYGDLYAKLASGVDWILADKLGLEPIHQEAWDLVQKDLPAWVGAPEKLRAGDRAAFSGLFKGLTMSGIAMQIYRDSRPASGAEHLVSHVWEMAHLSRDGVPVSHGFKVAMGTVLSVSLMEGLYAYPLEKLSVEGALRRRESWENREASIRRAFPDQKTADMVVVASRAKWPDEKTLAARLEKLIPLLPEMGGILRERLGSREKVIGDLKNAGCPVSTAEYGLDAGTVKETLRKAQMIRKRYTVLDAVYELGLFDEIFS